MKIQFFAKTTPFCDYAKQILLSHFPPTNVEFYEQGCAGGKIPDSAINSPGVDYIISFLSPWIIPEPVLKRAQVASLNFHPGPPEYPGTGCYNFALYDGVPEYGVTCHFMEPKVDTGRIVQTSYFKVGSNETVLSLQIKSMVHMLFVFDKVINQIALGQPLPKTAQTWTRKPYTRKELEALCIVDPATMTPEEIRKRVRATTYPGRPGPRLPNGEEYNEK